jgi:hypothetical protein
MVQISKWEPDINQKIPYPDVIIANYYIRKVYEKPNKENNGYDDKKDIKLCSINNNNSDPV